MEYRKWLTFLVFVIAAALLWFVFKYNQIYTQHIPLEVKWSNVPAHIKIQETDSDFIDVELSGNGFKLLNATFFSPSVNFDFQESVIEENNSYFFKPSSATGIIKESLSKDFKVEFVSTTKVEIQVIEYVSKKVPLVSGFQSVYKENLQTISEPFFKPDSVLVTGNDLLINDLKELRIEIPTLEINDTTFVRIIELGPLFPDFKTEPVEIDYVVNTAIMTEGSFQIPINVLNVPPGVSIKVIPSELTVVFNCQLKNYDHISIAEFMVELDYLNLEENYNTLTPNVIYKEELVNAVRFSPQQIQLLSIK